MRQIVGRRLTAQIRLAGECTCGIEIAVIATGGVGFANPDDFIDFGFGFDVLSSLANGAEANIKRAPQSLRM